MIPGVRRRGRVVMALAALALLTWLLAPAVGMKTVPLSSIWRPDPGSPEAAIFWRIRVPRVCVAFLAGAALAASGLVFQALFGNPLATPYTLGVAGGASFGAAMFVRLGSPLPIQGFNGVAVSAFAGASLTILIVYGLTLAGRGFSTPTMLLAGVALSFIYSSAILFVQYISDFSHSTRIMHWLMGGIDVSGFRDVLDMAPLALGGIAIVLSLTHELNLIATGEDIAASRGVDVVRTKKVLYFAVSLMVGGVVSICGPIGFVGMMVPHICRLVIGADHRFLLPASIFMGGMFLTGCDTVARTVIAPAEMPVGVITALLGGPFFIWLLVGNLSSNRGGRS